MSSSSGDREFIERWKHSLAPYNLGYKLKLASQLMYRDFLERLVPHSLTPFHLKFVQDTPAKMPRM